jgi:hypothetical protein
MRFQRSPHALAFDSVTELIFPMAFLNLRRRDVEAGNRTHTVSAARLHIQTVLVQPLDKIPRWQRRYGEPDDLRFELQITRLRLRVSHVPLPERSRFAFESEHADSSGIEQQMGTERGRIRHPARSEHTQKMCVGKQRDTPARRQ